MQVMCQATLPSGTFVDTSDRYVTLLAMRSSLRLSSASIDLDFATTCLSRFALSYLAASRGFLAKGGSVVSVFGPGVPISDLDIEDLSLNKKRDAGGWKMGLLAAKTQRNSCVNDTLTEVCCILPSELVPVCSWTVTGTQRPVPRPDVLSCASW